MAIELIITLKNWIWNPQGEIPIQVVRDGTKVKPSSLRLRLLQRESTKYSEQDQIISFEYLPLMPGEHQVTIEELVIDEFRREGISPIAINILTPFFHWQEYEWKEDRKISSEYFPDNNLPIYVPGKIKKSIDEFFKSSDNNILWLSGPPAGGKSYLIEYYLRRKRKDILLVKSEISSRHELRKQLSGNDTVAVRIQPEHQSMYAIMNTINQNPAIIIIDGSYATDNIIEDVILEMLLYQKKYEKNRKIAQNMSERFNKTRKFIITGIHTYDEHISGLQDVEEHISSVRPQTIEMGFWTQTDIKTYIKKNTKNKVGGCDIGNIEEIYHQTGGHPYLVNAYCDIKLNKKNNNYQDEVQKLYERYKKIEYLTASDIKCIDEFRKAEEIWFPLPPRGSTKAQQWERLKKCGVLIYNRTRRQYRMVKPFTQVTL